MQKGQKQENLAGNLNQQLIKDIDLCILIQFLLIKAINSFYRSKISSRSFGCFKIVDRNIFMNGSLQSYFSLLVESIQENGLLQCELFQQF
ncbi:unnamed protein product [Paramecium primaurelia]|uniref:Uncharacterized protein n=1 Tax=Paramecium primaurelia TaxID=5886 RepID=A0A8S1PBL2_PARPR|nr:unnamed protein product [Paramecium primaurelia]CAD8100579.1 unnamed protein product [Paramecium primaurelia]